MNATAPEPVASIARPPSHHWETARRTLEQPASVTFRGLLLNADEADGGRPEDFSSLVSLCCTVGHGLSCFLAGSPMLDSVGASEDHICLGPGAVASCHFPWLVTADATNRGHSESASDRGCRAEFSPKLHMAISACCWILE